MAQIWGDIVVSDDSLFKVIQEVRKIFKQHGLSSKTITNIYGKGYQVKVEINQAPKENETNIKPYVFCAVILLAVLITVIINRDTKSHISQQDFQQLVTSINSKFTEYPPNLNQFAVTEQSSEQDKIKMAYLMGLIHYKKGDYNNSVKELNTTLHLFDKNTIIPAMADTYLLLSKIYIYKNDKTLLKKYLDKAQHYYTKINHHKGLISTTISRARYHQTIAQYPQSIELLNHVLINAKSDNDKYNQMRAYANLAYSYQQTNKTSEYKNALEKSLSLALEIPDGSYASLAYGTLAKVNLNQGHYKKAMQYAQNTLKYAMAENDTNAFQQGFSSFYNILSDLGHDKLAEKKLNQAIAIQAQFNPEGRLIEAETNLALVKIKQKKYDEAHNIFIDLLNQKITDNENHRIKSWMALNDYYRKDNISAYTLAKTCLHLSDKKNQLIAYLALSLSSDELERNDEAIAAFKQAEELVDSDWLTEYPYFLDTALLLNSDIAPNKHHHHKYLQLKKSFDQKLTTIQKQTTPDASILDELNNHIKKIL